MWNEVDIKKIMDMQTSIDLDCSRFFIAHVILAIFFFAAIAIANEETNSLKIISLIYFMISAVMDLWLLI